MKGVRLVVVTLLISLAHGAAATPQARDKGDSKESKDKKRAEIGKGFRQFVEDDFAEPSRRAVETVASPWKLYSTALLISEAEKLGLPVEVGSLQKVLERFGFFFPETIGNWPAEAGEMPSFRDTPLGQTRGSLRALGVEIRNNGCALCHASPTYDAAGRPTKTAWIGLPNTSIDFDAYSRAIVDGLHKGHESPGGLLAAMRRVYPDMSWTERTSYRLFLLPRVRDAITAMNNGERLILPFDLGAPGITNGVAALKLQLGLIPRRGTSNEFGLTSIPDLANRAFRTSLLWDGVYATPGETRFRNVTRKEATPERLAAHAPIAAFFSMGTAGNSSENAERVIPAVARAIRALYNYEPPRFPGVIDHDLAGRGSAVFAARCTECHGRFETIDGRERLVEYPNRLVSLSSIGTDPERATAYDGAVAAWVKGHPDEPFVRLVKSKQTGGYVAPILSGVWATAPYLHNGSVPTLYVLMHPEERPERFQVGGHDLDLDRVGVALERCADGVYRFARPTRGRAAGAIYDTARRGRGHRGHEWQFAELTEPEKRALLEYLKTL